MDTAMRPIVFRGGIASFAIPVSWRQEYAPDGGGTFYEDDADTGTLRVNVLSFQKKEPMALDVVAQEVFAGEAHEVLSCGFPMRHHMKKAEERGTPLHLYRWEVLVPVLPGRWRLVCFTHTIVAAQDGSDRANQELRLVDVIVREAAYSTEPGILPKKLWWRFW